jgi:spermidine/putrescine transport system permease protein
MMPVSLEHALSPDTTTSAIELPNRGGSRRDSIGLSLKFFTAVVLLGLYLPVVVLVIFSFNDNIVTTLPLRGFTLEWYRKALSNEELLRAAFNSLYVGVTATAITLVLGTAGAFAIDRTNFPGKNIFRRLVVLPLILPGIITGISMLNFFRVLGFNLSLETVILGHATALTSVVITQVYARLLRLNRRIEEASSDLGASRWQTFLYITLPNIRSALIGSGLLCFTLSFDEIPVTFFLTGRDNTLPMYIYSTLRKGITPEINAIGTIIIISSLVLILISISLLRDEHK